MYLFYSILFVNIFFEKVCVLGLFMRFVLCFCRFFEVEMMFFCCSRMAVS